MTEVKNDRLHGLHVHEVEVRGDLGEVSTLRGTFQDHRLNFRTPERPLIPVIFVIPVILGRRACFTIFPRPGSPSFLSFSSFLSSRAGGRV